MREMSMVEMQEVNGGHPAVVLGLVVFGCAVWWWSMKKLIDKLKKAGLWPA